MVGRTVLTASPGIPALLVKAAVGGRSRDRDLPDTRLARTGVVIDRAKLAAYERLCRFPVTDELPPTYPHILAFPLQLALMTDRSFPVPAPGLVHVRNRITVTRPIDADELLDIDVWASDLAAHRKGVTVDLCAAVTVGGEPVWQSRSTYLARGATVPDGAAPMAVESDGSVPVDLPRTTAIWRVPADAGRRYAKVSGDINPIHLSALTAKPFGFKRAIAHGMWVKARALAAFAGRLPDALSIDVAFDKPLYLPSTVALSTAPAGGGWDFAVSTTRKDIRHLVGTVRPG